MYISKQADTENKQNYMYNLGDMLLMKQQNLNAKLKK